MKVHFPMWKMRSFKLWVPFMACKKSSVYLSTKRQKWGMPVCPISGPTIHVGPLHGCWGQSDSISFHHFPIVVFS